MSKKRNLLLDKIIEIMNEEKRGIVLDIGCGDGDYSFGIKKLGFQVTALDIDDKRFRYKDEIEFIKCDITKGLPFSDNSFDYVLFLEVIEHLYNPYFVIQEINRLLKPGGLIILSTPNILNIRSRLRFFFEGSFDFFREPTLEYSEYFGNKNIHVTIWRYQELEYLFAITNLRIEKILTDLIKTQQKLLAFVFQPIIKLQLYFKRFRSLKKGGIDYTRIHRLLLSPELLLGRHLIIKARKE
ncbi:MAG: class I SAM-dependent methyltransferase [Candidatus Omnitrophica bacterium]|nr:class I SAM-dependent methyltransferase [Candidatus Omnitrophota bacterium]